MSKVFKVSIVTILLTAGSFFYIKLNLKFLFDYNVKKYVNYNFQGIECIDEELYLISNLDHKIYKDWLEIKFCLDIDNYHNDQLTFLFHY